MRNIRLIVKYDGSRYKGFQRLKDNDMTIQNKIESVLSKMTGEDIEIIGSGRTDMGVHSLGQVVNFKTNSDMSLEKMNEYLYRYLPEDMVIKDIKQVSDRFHSRYNAVSKTYLYKIYNDKYHDPFYRKYTLHIKDILDIKLMQEASDILVGKHDFTSFASSKSKKKSNIRQINKIDIIKQDNIVNIYINADGFLYNMVRIIVGCLIDIGLGKITKEDLKNMLEAKDRTKSSDTAQAKGLYLYEVFYNN